MPPSKPNEPQRIAKLLARAGIASRREIERMIADGRIALDGQTLDTPATLLTSLRGVTVDGNPVAEAEPARLFRYHKAAGLLTAERDFTGRPTIYDRMPPDLPRVMPVGRLDLNTEGLLLLTTDGELKRELELPATGVERSYRARAYGQVSQPQLEALMLGVEIEGIRYGPINANIERRTGANVWIEMTLTEGKNREVRRVLEYLGLEVSRLIRTRYGPFYLGDLPPGDVDEIRQSDLSTFRTVLSKPGGGKAASNLQFSVRARVVAPPKPQPVVEPDRRLRRAPAKPAPAPEQGPRFTPRATPAPRRAEEAERPARFAPRGTRGDAAPDKPVRSGRGAARADKRPDTAGERPSRFARRGERSDAAGERPARVTPRGTRPEAPSEHALRFARGASRPEKRPEAGDGPRKTLKPANPARAERARAHRETQEPRAGDIVDRPRGQRPSRGPAGGRGKPSKPARPPRTRK